jgi:hypothetical protein
VDRPGREVSKRSEGASSLYMTTSYLVDSVAGMVGRIVVGADESIG